MSIENTLERIADSLERLVDLQAGRNLLLESAALARADAAEVAEAAVEKAATKGRGRPRKGAAEEPKVEEPAAEEPAAEKPAAEKPAAEKPAAEEPAAEEPAAEKPAAGNVPSVESLQLRAPKLAQAYGKEKVTGLIKQLNPEHGNISSMTDEQRMGLWAALDALEAGASSESEFG